MDPDTLVARVTWSSDLYPLLLSPPLPTPSCATHTLYTTQAMVSLTMATETSSPNKWLVRMTMDA